MESNWAVAGGGQEKCRRDDQHKGKLAMTLQALLLSMAIRVVEFSNGGYKIRKIFAKESTYSKEIIEFWELG